MQPNTHRLVIDSDQIFHLGNTVYGPVADDLHPMRAQDMT